jgi:hypothetical protein
MDPVTVGVLGQQWRANVTPWGAIEQWDGLGTVDWFVAADDRWHVPSAEPTVRQLTVDGTPVVETRLRIPNGDAVQRVYAVADHGGLTVVEIENDSSLPIAVAFTGAALLSSRPPTDVPIQGIDLPGPAVSFPVGHRATLTVAIAHGAAPAALPANLPSATQVARGWLSTCERASRLILPEAALAASVTRARCELALCGPDDLAADPVAFLLGVGELVRMGSVAEHWIPEVADAVAVLADHRTDPFLAAAVDAAERVCIAADESRAVRDLAKVRARLVDASDAALPEPTEASGARLVAAVEGIIARGPALFPGGIPAAWLGQHLEVYGIPTGPSSAVSFAMRWHGERPALLWEQTGAPVALRSPVVAPDWSSTAATGDALWPAPPVPAGFVPLGDDISFG